MKRIFIGWSRDYSDHYDSIFRKETFLEKCKTKLDNFLYSLFIKE